MTLFNDSAPHYADWATWLVQLSDLVAQCYDAMATEEDDETKYRNVLLFDAKMRAHGLPASLRSRSNEDWLRRVRQETTIMRANKIALIHRRFLGKSLVNERYAYSRWASIEASRTLIHEVERAWSVEKTRPTFWNDQVNRDLNLLRA